MNRRTFLAGCATAVAGCGRPAAPVVAPPAGPVLSDADLARIAAEGAARDRHVAQLAGCRVETPRTTPPPPDDVLKLAPELKPLLRIAVRLHPRFGDEPAADASKLGGRFAWPAGEPWPECDEHCAPLVPVLQLRADDAPPQFPMRPNADLVQLLWCPRDHGPETVRVQFGWRRTPADPADGPPTTDAAFPAYVPAPCRVFPERVAEFPHWDALPAAVRAKLDAERYADLLSVAPGTKAGGYPRFGAGAKPPACPTCRWGMDYVLTVAADEWDDRTRPRWQPAEERDSASDGYRRAAGLVLGDAGAVRVFVCRRCPDWPVRAG